MSSFAFLCAVAIVLPSRDMLDKWGRGPEPTSHRYVEGGLFFLGALAGGNIAIRGLLKAAK